MNEIKAKMEKNLKESSNPLNDEGENDNNPNSNSSGNNQSSVDSAKGLNDKTHTNILKVPLNKNIFEEQNKKSSLSENQSENSLKIKINENKININQNKSTNKKDRYILEQKMRKDLDKNYKEIEKEKYNFRKKNFINDGQNINNENSINNYIPTPINEINKNKKYILLKLVIINIILLILITLKMILYKILRSNLHSNNIYLYITSLSLSCALSCFTLFLIILIILGVFHHYYTSNIFRFLCLINFCISFSLLIIQIILIMNFKSSFHIKIENKLKKIFIYFLIFIATIIILLVNALIGIIAKDSFLIIFGCKNESACPERKIKKRGSKMGGKYVYFNEEYDESNINANALKKFHACIYSSKKVK